MEWLQNLFEKLTSVFPRLRLVDVDEAAVRITLGTKVKSLGPGGYVHWPVIQSFTTIKIKTQVKDLRPQSVWTKDRRELAISGAVRYSVRDARKAVLECYDYDDNVVTLALGIIQRYTAQASLDELDVSELEAEMLRGLREACAGWGLKIEAVYITDVGRTRNLRLLLQGVEWP
jgi:regulator of protease activity HflC (stomatin/prohibitin superfamily)